MTKKILLSTVVAAALTTSAFAGGNAGGETTARLDALNLTNAQTKDFSNIWMNAAFVAGQKDTVFAQNSGQQAETGFMGAVKDTGFGVLGIFLGRDSTAIAAYGQALGGAVTVDNAGTNMDILYGYSMGGIDLGLRFSTKSAAEVTSATTDNSQSETDIEVGVNLKDMGLDLSVGITSVSETVTPVLTTDLAGTGKLTANVRYTALKNMLIEANYANETDKLTTSGTVTAENTTTNMGLSLTHENKVNASTTMFTNVGYVNNATGSGLTTVASSQTLLPITFSIESKRTANWTLRGSVRSNLWGSMTNTDAAGVETKVAAQNGNFSQVRLGAGYTEGALTIDGVLTYADPLLGVASANWFAGNNAFDQLFGKLTATYNF